MPRWCQVNDLGFVTGRLQPGLCQQHDITDAVLHEGGYVRPPPGCATGSCIEDADEEGMQRWKNRMEVNHENL